jgi:hypothetical protein
MGLALEVGILADLRENDSEGYEHYLKQFDALNKYLEEVGLATHHEPENCEVWSCEMYGYSGLHYLRRIAAHFDLTGNLPLPGNKDSSKDVTLQKYYQKAESKSPGFFARLLPTLPKYQFGFNHLILHSDAEGFYLPIEFKEVLYPDSELGIAGGMIGSTIKLLRECERLAKVLEIPSNVDEKSEELWEAADAQGESSIKWQKYGVESFTCVHLIKACKKSIETGAAIIFT